MTALELFNIFTKHGANKVDQTVDHFAIGYCREIINNRDVSVNNVLEIGVQSGGSLRSWSEVFPRACIHGIDIDPDCKEHESDRIHIHIGSQSDCRFLEEQIVTHGPFDVIIDDGSHLWSDQQTSLEVLWSSLSKYGTYAIEDLHTSYFQEFNDADLSTSEYLKNLITTGLDKIHVETEWRRRGGKYLPADRIGRSPLDGIVSMCFYGCLCFLKNH